MSSQPAEVSVPLLDLSGQYRPIRDEILAALTRVADSQQYILGAEVEAFERDVANALEVDHAIGVSSGTDALIVTMMALGIGPGAEVITPSYSFFATAGSIRRVGATPVFVDVDPVTFNVDVAAVARAMSPRTKAILPVHLYGLTADIDPIMDLAKRAAVPVIEDAAQAIGARYHGHLAGGLGTAGCLSFFPTKNLGGFGDGGLVTTNDPKLAHEIRLLRVHGAEPKYVHGRIGGNFRLDALQAAVLRVKLPHLSQWTSGRRRNADRYRALFAEYGLEQVVSLPVEPSGFTHVFNQFVIRTARRDALRAALADRRVGTEIYYPIPLHRQGCFDDLGRTSDAFPVADQAAATSLALPIFAELSAAQQRHVVASIAAFFDRQR
jgi:dTDP-4-amino-4,6-dideoxygalactose transaminase